WWCRRRDDADVESRAEREMSVVLAHREAPLGALVVQLSITAFVTQASSDTWAQKLQRNIGTPLEGHDVAQVITWRRGTVVAEVAADGERTLGPVRPHVAVLREAGFDAQLTLPV